MSGNEDDKEYRDGPKDTIEVRGPENLINRYQLDLMQLHFENQKDMNGSITDIWFDAADAVVVIKFDSEQAAKKIIECPSQILRGESLNVKLRQNPNIHSRFAQTTNAASIVRVSGLKRIEAKEIVKYYFTNRIRSGGGPIMSFVPVESDGDIYEITFENTKDAKSVVERRHVINGLSVNVTLLHKDCETEYYKDRFLIKGLQNNLSDEFLLYFIKAVTGIKPKFLAFHKTENDVVLVIIGYDLDIAQLIEQCRDETLEGANIQIYEVEVSNVIHVSNLPENIHSDTILLYFENKSKVGIVKNVIRLDKASCLVYFEDYKVIESVIGHVHFLQRRDLTVRRYFKCVTQTEDEAFSTNIPQAVVIPDLDIRALRFIQQNEKFKQIVEQELLSHHAKVYWSKEGSDSCEVSINCIVDESKVLSNRYMIRWEKEIRELFKFLMDKIYVHCITLIGEYYLDDSCVECTAENKENTLVLLNKGKSMITFVGTSQKLVSTLRSDDNFSGDAEEEFKVEKVFLAHAVEFKMLRSLGYREKIAREVPHISIKESKNDLAVELEGHLLDVRKAKLIMLDIKNEFKTVFFYPLSALSSNLYSNLPTVDFVNKRLQYAGLECIWSVSHTKLNICCHNKYDSEVCMDVIKTSVIDDVIHEHLKKVDSCDICLVDKKINEIEAKYPGKVAISLTVNNEIHLCSTKDIREVILEYLRATIQKQKDTNACRSKEEPVDPEPENREPSEPETPEENQTKIVVSNLPSTAHDEFLQMYFENKRKFKECNVYSVETDEDGTSAIIEFETPEAVDVVLSKCPLNMMGQEVEISKYDPPPPVLLCTVEVTGPFSIVSEDHLEMLEMYFENSKRSGGGDVVDIEFDTVNNMVLVTFDSEGVAQRVAEKGKHVIRKEKLNVKVHIPSKKSKKPDDKDKEIEEEEKTEPPNTIKVKGINKSASRDTVEFYFENSRRSGGGEIETIKSDDEDEEVLYITFKSTEVAVSVSKRTHKLEGKSLNVALYVPPVAPPSYDNKILLKGLQASTTQDCLFNFIKAKSGCVPETMDTHSEKEDVVMITFSEKPDFQKLESAFNKYKLEGALLTICPVPISNCIIVANLASDVTKDTIEFYFENKRKSGGGQVEKVVMNEDDTCLVYFADYSVIDDVLEKEHTLSKQLLDVKRYQECLGRPEGEVSKRVLRLPEDIVLTNVDAKKLKFFKYSIVNRMGIEKQLDPCHATIVWPEEGEKVILKCTLTNEVKDCFKIIKTWKKTALENFKVFMELIIVKKVKILMDIWGKVIEELQKFNIENPEAVAIFVDKNESVITVVGNQNVAEDLSTKIENMTKDVMTEVEKEREKIKETITSLKNIETRMLIVEQFSRDMEKLFPDLKVNINQIKNEILFEGPTGQVRDAKLKMYELKARFAVDFSQKISELAARLLVLRQTKEHVVKKLKASRVRAVWDTVDEYLEVYCTNQDQINICVDVIRTSVFEHTVVLKKATKTLVNSEKWQTKVDELHRYYPGKCIIKVSEDSKKVQICATDDIANEILDNVKVFLRQNTFYEAKVPCTRNVHRLIEKHHKNEISNIAKGLTNYNVYISSVQEYGGFEVYGTEDGLYRAVQQLHQLLLKVKQKELIMTKPGLRKYMQTPKGKDNLNTIESMHQCVVAVKRDNDDDEITDNPYAYDTVPIGSDGWFNIGGVKGMKIVASSIVKGSRNVYTIQGDMTELNVDMLVNSTDDRLNLNGGLGKAIVQKGGIVIKKECADYIRVNDKLHDGDTFVSSAGTLRASAIVHVKGPVWHGGLHQEEKMLQDAVLKCLHEAHYRNLKSVALTAISCGTSGYPVRRATQMIVSAVKNFYHDVQYSNVTDIYLCDMNSNTIEAFNEALRKEFGVMNVQISSARHDSMRQQSTGFSSWFGFLKQTQTNRRQTREKPAKNQNLNKVIFIILAMSENNIDQAIAKLESCVDKEVCSKKIDGSIIKNMNGQQIMEIQTIAAKHHLDVKVEAFKGQIQISGLSANVSRASDNINRILRHAVTVEQERKTADLMSNHTQWSYVEDGEDGQTLKAYDKDLNYKIESAYIAKAANVIFRQGRTKFILDFTRMKEYPEDDPYDCVTVIRGDDVKQKAFEAPAHWIDMTGNRRVEVLQAGSPEYNDISQKFTASAGGTFTVVKIERIQNKTLWSQYEAKKKQLENQNPPGTINERLLWHGSAVEAVDSINALGFNRSYCGGNAAMYGDGVYFAANAQYSCRDTYSRPDPTGIKRIYYCRVLTGECTQGKRGMRVPPSKGGPGSTALYDSVADDPVEPWMYILFHDTQAYPEYLISFK